MVARNVFACAVLVASLLVLPVNAQRVLLLPGAGSTVSVFANDTLTAMTPISATSGAFAILANPAGTRYFVVSSANVAVADAGGAKVQEPVGVGLPITAAAITPDGRKVLVAAGTSSAGTLYIFDISGGTMTQLAAVPIGFNPSGLTANLDSRSAFVVTASGLSRVDLASSSPTVTKTVSLTGVAAPASKVVAGPNGFLYVNAEGALYEVNPSNMAVQTISMAAFPSKPTFTPDGSTALLGNPGARDTIEPALMTVDLATRTIKNRLNWFSVGFDYMVWGGPDRLYAYSGTHRKLYELTKALGGIDEADLPVVGRIPTVLAAFNSTEFPNGQGIVGPKYLFVLAPSALYRIDLDSAGSTPPDQIAKSAPLSVVSPGGIFFTPPATANSTIAGTLQYGNNQSLAGGAESAPLVFRALDYFGKPIMGMPVTFTPSVGTIVSSMAETNSEGLAEATVKAPEAGGEFSVTATPVIGSNVVFMLNGGSSGGGGTDPGTGPGASGISVLSGNGQVVRGGGYTYEPILLMVRDGNGSPLPGADVTFSVGSGLGGSIVGTSCTTATGGVVCETDSNGQVSVNFLAPSVTDQSDSWKQVTITASVPGLSGVTTQSITLYETAVPAQTTAGFDGPLQFPKLIVPSAVGTTFTVPAGQTLIGAIKVLTYAQSGPFIGTAMPRVGLQVRATRLYDPSVPSPASCVGGTILSGADGMATCDLFVPANTQPGTYPIFAVSGGNTALNFNIVVTAAPAPVPVPTTAVVMSGNNQSGTAGQTVSPLVALVKDQLGNAMANVTVQWSVVSGSATLTSPATKTGTDGRASTGIVLGSTAGAVVVRMTAGSATPAVFNLTVTVAVGNLTKASGDGQSVVVGQQFQPVSVKVTDTTGNAIAGVSVNFNVTSGAATPSTHTAVTDASGVALATFTATNNPGQIVITASGAGKSVTFNLAARLPGPLLTANSFLNAASMQPGVGFGSIVAIKGDGLTTGLTIPPGACLTQVSDGNLERGLPTRLAGIEVWFSTQIAPIFAICKNLDGSEQINVQAPFELAPATITAMVTTGIGTAAEMNTFVDGVQISNALPGIFEYDVSSSARAAVALRPDGTVVSPSNQARRGEVIRVFTTGLGPVLPVGDVPVKTNQPGYPGQKPFFVTSVQLGGSGAPGVTAEYAQNLIGVFIVTFQVPADAQTGAAVPLIVSVLKDNGQTVSSKASSIPIAQ